LSIDDDPALLDDLLGLAPRGDAGVGQDFLEALFGHQVSWGVGSCGGAGSAAADSAAAGSATAGSATGSATAGSAGSSDSDMRRISSNSFNDGSSLRSFNPNWIMNSLV